jgi:hypothetical protein
MLTTNDTAVFKRAHAIHNAGRSPELGARWEHPVLVTASGFEVLTVSAGTPPMPQSLLAA